MNPLDSMIVTHPDWMFHQAGPRFDQALRGIRYEFFYEHAKILNAAFEREASRGQWSLRLRYGAIGPALFFGRSNGPWLNYDPSKFDENSQMSVEQRPGPWNLGDHLWELWIWESGQPEFVTIERSIQEYFSIFYWGAAARGDPIDSTAARWVQRRAHEQSSGFAKLTR